MGSGAHQRPTHSGGVNVVLFAARGPAPAQRSPVGRRGFDRAIWNTQPAYPGRGTPMSSCCAAATRFCARRKPGLPTEDAAAVSSDRMDQRRRLGGGTLVAAALSSGSCSISTITRRPDRARYQSASSRPRQACERSGPARPAAPTPTSLRKPQRPGWRPVMSRAPTAANRPVPAPTPPAWALLPEQRASWRRRDFLRGGLTPRPRTPRSGARSGRRRRCCPRVRAASPAGWSGLGVR